MRIDRFLSVGIFFILSAYYALFLAHPINLMTADLGRHLKNGEILFQEHRLVETNFYSYSHPDFPATNHHWASGALFYLVFQTSGFTGVHILFIGLSVLAFGLFLRLAWIRGSPLKTALLSLLVIPLLSQRAEVRPEVLSYLFAGIFFWILLRAREREISPNWLWTLLAVEILWANSHIYFFLGPAITAAFLLEASLKKQWPRAKTLSLLLLGLFASTMLNPFGIKGAIAPFNIMQNYGYRLVENLPILEIQRLLPGNPNYLIFKLVFALLVISYIFRILKNRRNFDWAMLFLAMGFSAMGWLMLRNLTVFGLFALVIISSNFGVIAGSGDANPANTELPRPADGPRGNKAWLSMAIAAFALILALSGELKTFFPQLHKYRLGLAPGIAQAARFFRDQNIQGPVFNNYDIGGYLIFELFPAQRVFVDNRPEAYPASFFQKEYIPMQEDENIWRQEFQKYNFQSIFFWRHDHTPWAQTFLKNRSSDPEWRRVYLDDYAVIYTRISLSSGDWENGERSGQ